MKNIGVRESRDHATSYLSGEEPVLVSKHGQVIGVYIPVKRDPERVQRALDRRGETREADSLPASGPGGYSLRETAFSAR